MDGFAPSQVPKWQRWKSYANEILHYPQEHRYVKSLIYLIELQTNKMSSLKELLFMTKKFSLLSWLIYQPTLTVTLTNISGCWGKLLRWANKSCSKDPSVHFLSGSVSACMFAWAVSQTHMEVATVPFLRRYWSADTCGFRLHLAEPHRPETCDISEK